MCGCGSYDPWRHAGVLGVSVDWYDELGVRGDYYKGHVRLNRKLLQVEARCTLAHELVHHERGDDGAYCSEWHRDRAERLVHLVAARRLITLCDLADAIAEHGDEGLYRPRAAAMLQVDPRTLQLMITSLKRYERDAIKRRLTGLRA